MTMPSPKDIKKILKATQGTSTAGKALDLEELLGKLPKGSKEQQLEAELMFKRLAEEQAARYAPTNPPTERGNAALAAAKKTLAKKKPAPKVDAQKQALEEELARLQAGKEGFLEPSQIKERLYHGTTATEGGTGEEAIRRFKPSKEGALGSGVYLTPDTTFAGSYAEQMGGNMLPVYVQMKNPLILRGSGVPDKYKDPMVEALEALGVDSSKAVNMVDRAYETKGYIGKEVESRAKAAGYDGLLQYDHNGNLVEVVSYKPSAIKSAIGNEGTYDITNPDITKAEGGEVQHLQVGGIPKALKTISNVGKAEKSMEAAKNLMQANRPLSLAERQFVAEVAARQAEELASLRPQQAASIETKGAKRDVPPRPARAKPKTKQQISAVAERVAPQMLGEFVRKPGKTEDILDRSRKQWDIEQELQHDMQRSREVPEAAEISLEPHKDSVMVSLPGDTSISDYDIFGISGQGLHMPSRQYGGSRFGLAHPEEAGWASGLVPASGFQRLSVNEASQQFGDVPVLAAHMAMGPQGTNYALHYTDALLKSIRPETMKAKDIDAFNRMVRAGTPKNSFLDFPGIEYPEASYLYFAENPAARKHFNALMQLTDTTQALGLPSGLNVRHAITEPAFLNLEPGMTGHSVLQMQPGVTELKPSMHPTYSHDIPGLFLGRTDILYPYEMMFPDTVEMLRASPSHAQSIFPTIQKTGSYSGRQIIDQQLIDELGEYRRRIKQLTGKKDGGPVHMAGGNEPGQSIGEMFSPKPLTIPAPLTELADAIRRQFSKEKRSMSKPGAATDVLLRGPVAFAAGTPMDLIGMGGAAVDYLQTRIPGLRKKASVMDTGPERTPPMGYAPKVQVSPELSVLPYQPQDANLYIQTNDPKLRNFINKRQKEIGSIPIALESQEGVTPYGTESFQEKLNQAGLTTGEERPLFELGTAVALPFAASKALQYGEAGAKALLPTAEDILQMQLERATAPMRMNVVPEGGAKLSKEEYSRMMREKYAAQNAAKEQKTATAGDLKREEVKVPADNLGLYSPGQKAAANLQRNIGTGEAFLSDLKKAPDVGEADLLHTGLEDWLRNKKTVTKQEIQDYMAANRLKLRQHELSGEGVSDDMRFGRPEIVDDYEYINARAKDYVNDWDDYGYRPRSEIRQEILEKYADDQEYIEDLLNSGRIDDLVEDEVSSLAYEFARDEYYDNPYRQWTNNAGYSIMGNDDVGYSVVSPTGRVVNQSEIYDFETAEGIAQQHGISSGYAGDGGTQYSSYQLPGPSSNYREHLTQIDRATQRSLRESELNDLARQMNQATDPIEKDRLLNEYNRLKEDIYEIYSGAHHDVEDIMSHSRTQDRVDIDGNNVLHVDELQSDMHQDGSEFGYKTPETRKRYKDLMSQRQGLATEFGDARGKLQEIVDARTRASYAPNADLDNLPLQKEFDAATKKADDLARKIDKINDELSDIEKAVPDAPFKKDWAEKEFKKLLNLAAKEGKDRITLSRWQDQLERWGTDSLAFRKTKTGEWVIGGTKNRNLSDLDMNDTITPKDVAEIVFAREGEYDCNSIEGLRAFIKRNVARGWSNAHLDRVTNKAWDQMQKLNPGEMGAIDPRKDGFKSTYGKSYIDMMQKLARKYGGKTGITKIDKGGFDLVDVPYIELSGNLKKSSIKGFPYKDGGAVRMAEGGAVDYESRFNQMLQDHVAGMAEGGAVDYESRFNDMLQKHVQGLAEGGEVENEYNSEPDMSDGGRFIQAPAFADGGAV